MYEYISVEHVVKIDGWFFFFFAFSMYYYRRSIFVYRYLPTIGRMLSIVENNTTDNHDYYCD